MFTGNGTVGCRWAGQLIALYGRAVGIATTFVVHDCRRRCRRLSPTASAAAAAAAIAAAPFISCSCPSSCAVAFTTGSDDLGGHSPSSSFSAPRASIVGTVSKAATVAAAARVEAAHSRGHCTVAA